MCTVCGCGEDEARIEGQAHAHDHHHAHDHDRDHHEHDHGHSHEQGRHPSHDHEHRHSHDHAHPHDHHDHSDGAGNDLHFGQGPARAHVPGMSQERMVQIEQDILGKNDRYAAANRQHFAEHGLFVLNLVSSPGSGKTTLLTQTIERLKERVAIGVIEGDQQTSNDADRIRATGVPAVQINTGKGCHLDAHMVGHALERLNLRDDGLLLVENVGNLVCPAAFDLGEHHKVAILSVTEGEDKPLKYPDMFHAADLMLLNKVDLLPYLDFDVTRCIEYAQRVNPDIQVLQVSATAGTGMEAWVAWIEAGMQRATRQKSGIVDKLQQRITELEHRLATLQSKSNESA
ncbi:MAG: hydrogenase nickel incorporation protein HypB [Proteobacteria bacterium]|nr:MAG: hydrogenase nickel incorporation protein HypB [Pseudomonadota bacterium]